MKIRITRTIKKVGLFNRSFEIEETIFLYSNINYDELFPLIKAIGETIPIDKSNEENYGPMVPLTKEEAADWMPPKDKSISHKSGKEDET